MTIRHARLALVVIAAAGAASAGNAQIIESPRQRTSDTSTLHIAPLARQGSAQNVADLLNAGGAHAAILPSDVLPYLRDGRLPGADSSIGYIKKLDQEEVHILARQDINSIADLAGKKVNFDLRDSRAFITGSVLFHALKINVQPPRKEGDPIVVTPATTPPVNPIPYQRKALLLNGFDGCRNGLGRL